MDLPDNTLPDRAGKRFAVGFGVTAVVVFAVVFLYGNSMKEAAIDAGSAALIVGLVGGVLSAFGKKLLRCVLTFCGEVISNP